MPRDYNIRVATANGVTRAAPVELRMVEVGNITVRNVPALVHPDEALGVIVSRRCESIMLYER